MKQIILKYTDPDGETEYFRFEGNLMLSVSCTAFNVFAKFSESFKDFTTVEKLEAPIEFLINDEDYQTLLKDDEAEDELVFLAQCEIEKFFEEYLISDDIAFDLSQILSNEVALLLAEECSQRAQVARKRADYQRFLDEIKEFPIDKHLDDQPNQIDN